MLDDCPNYFIDISARLGELGRQPYTARKFFLQYQDRILFGSDMSPDLDAYRLCYRLLETDDEAYSDYEGVDVRGKHLLVYAGEPRDLNVIFRLTGSDSISD